MAILRGREVSIVGVMEDIDFSTFRVRYPDGETEIAKLHELKFSQDEYKQHVESHLPVVSFIEEVPQIDTPVTEKKSKK